MTPAQVLPNKTLTLHLDLDLAPPGSLRLVCLGLFLSFNYKLYITKTLSQYIC
jgi:hypothetical protein